MPLNSLEKSLPCSGYPERYRDGRDAAAGNAFRFCKFWATFSGKTDPVSNFANQTPCPTLLL